jgi:hypothetical protein
MRLQFKVPFEEQPEQPLELMAHVLDHHGCAVASAPIADGSFTLDLADHADPDDLRIAIAPVRPDRREAPPTQAQLARLLAYEPVLKIDAKASVQEIKAIPSDLSKHWFLCSCRVRGKVVKPVGSAAVVDYPVCHARVHICEVDPFWWIIDVLPDPLVYKLRDEYLVAREKPVIPHPEPGPDPIAELQVQSHTEMLMSAGTAASAPAFASTSTLALRKELKANVELLIPYICSWEWLWPWLACDPLTTVETDENGRFDVTIFHRCDDQPDLYFWVEYFIGGVWTTVYAPGTRCATHWDYDCASEVTLRIYDPRVPYCGGHDSVQGKNVVVKTIGNDMGVNEVLDASAGAREGLVPGAVSTGSDSPFAGTLELRVDFGEGLLAAGITKYQWSYSKLTDDPMHPIIDGWHTMTHPVNRHYRTVDSAGNPVDLVHPLGPDANGRMDVWNPEVSFTPAGNHKWPVDDARVDLVSGFFDPIPFIGLSDDPHAGRYVLKLELFKGAAAAPVDWTAEGIGLYEPNVPAPFGNAAMTTVESLDRHRILAAGHHTMGFQIVVHVDNSRCEAAIYDVTVGPHASGPCGFIDYPAGATAHVSFQARHAHDFATFNFETDKGSSGIVAPGSASGRVGDTPNNGFARDAASVFSKDVPITGAGSLVDSPSACPGGRAAFAETIYVAATATDGWSRASWLDASATPKAFALTPEPLLIAAPIATTDE